MVEGLIDTIIRSKRRTLGLEIASDARLIVRAPSRASMRDIHRAVSEKLPWILEKQRLTRERSSRAVNKQFVDGEMFMFLGREYRLSVVRELSRPFDFDGNGFFAREEGLASIKDIFTEWYRLKAFEIIESRARYYADKHCLRYGRIRISNAGKRWGSCGHNGTINFSWRLVMAPMMVVDYVVAHELAHLVERNHRSRFWAKVREIFPKYREAAAWLREDGGSLTL
jgi:predicted metal-dependent hydrolase